MLQNFTNFSRQVTFIKVTQHNLLLEEIALFQTKLHIKGKKLKRLK